VITQVRKKDGIIYILNISNAYQCEDEGIPRNPDCYKEVIMESTAVEVMDLTVQEKTELAELETVIENGMKHFLVVGRALLRIRDSRLYRDTHRTFNDYCRDRWGMTRMRASQLIAAVAVSENVNPGLQIGEKHLRPLTRLEPEKQREVWQEAVETAPGGKVTAEHVEDVVGRIQGRNANVRQIPEAMKIAMIAISQLERIRDNDPLRVEALDYVIGWATKWRDRHD
jgi:hypothetical protein